jgi:hypothetical protein
MTGAKLIDDSGTAALIEAIEGDGLAIEGDFVGWHAIASCGVAHYIRDAQIIDPAAEGGVFGTGIVLLGTDYQEGIAIWPIRWAIIAVADIAKWAIAGGHPNTIDE